MYERVRRIDEVDAMVAEWAATQSKEELFQGLVACGVPCSPVRELSEMMADEHLHDRNALIDVDHPLFGPMTLPTSPLVFEGWQRTIRWPSRGLGADQDEVFAAVAESESGGKA